MFCDSSPAQGKKGATEFTDADHKLVIANYLIRLLGLSNCFLFIPAFNGCLTPRANLSYSSVHVTKRFKIVFFLK